MLARAWTCSLQGKFSAEQVEIGKRLLHETVALLIGLTKSISADRLGEEEIRYRILNDGSE